MPLLQVVPPFGFERNCRPLDVALLKMCNIIGLRHRISTSYSEWCLYIEFGKAYFDIILF